MHDSWYSYSLTLHNFKVLIVADGTNRVIILIYERNCISSPWRESCPYAVAYRNFVMPSLTLPVSVFIFPLIIPFLIHLLPWVYILRESCWNKHYLYWKQLAAGVIRSMKQTGMQTHSNNTTFSMTWNSHLKCSISASRVQKIFHRQRNPTTVFWLCCISQIHKYPSLSFSELLTRISRQPHSQHLSLPKEPVCRFCDQWCRQKLFFLLSVCQQCCRRRVERADDVAFHFATQN